MKDINPITKSC